MPATRPARSSHGVAASRWKVSRASATQWLGLGAAVLGDEPLGVLELDDGKVERRLELTEEVLGGRELALRVVFRQAGAQACALGRERGGGELEPW